VGESGIVAGSEDAGILDATAPAWQVLDKQDERDLKGLTGWNLSSQQSAVSIQEAGGVKMASEG